MSENDQSGHAGRWPVASESTASIAPGVRIAFLFHTRDLSLVLGAVEGRRPVHFRMTIDSKSEILSARLADRVKALVAQSEMTPQDLARQSGLPIARVRKILVGEHSSITIRDMDKIARALGTSVYDFLVP